MAIRGLGWPHLVPITRSRIPQPSNTSRLHRHSSGDNLPSQSAEKSPTAVRSSSEGGFINTPARQNLSSAQNLSESALEKVQQCWNTSQTSPSVVNDIVTVASLSADLNDVFDASKQSTTRLERSSSLSQLLHIADEAGLVEKAAYPPSPVALAVDSAADDHNLPPVPHDPLEVRSYDADLELRELPPLPDTPLDLAHYAHGARESFNTSVRDLIQSTPDYPIGRVLTMPQKKSSVKADKSRSRKGTQSSHSDVQHQSELDIKPTQKSAQGPPSPIGDAKVMDAPSSSAAFPDCCSEDATPSVSPQLETLPPLECCSEDVTPSTTPQRKTASPPACCSEDASPTPSKQESAKPSPKISSRSGTVRPPPECCSEDNPAKPSPIMTQPPLNTPNPKASAENKPPLLVTTGNTPMVTAPMSPVGDPSSPGGGYFPGTSVKDFASGPQSASNTASDTVSPKSKVPAITVSHPSISEKAVPLEKIEKTPLQPVSAKSTKASNSELSKPDIKKVASPIDSSKAINSKLPKLDTKNVEPPKIKSPNLTGNIPAVPAQLPMPIDITGKLTAPPKPAPNPKRRERIIRKGQKAMRKGRKVVLQKPVLAIVVGRNLAGPTADALKLISKGMPIDPAGVTAALPRGASPVPV